MKTATVSVGSFDENCSVIVLDDGAAWVVDPGQEPQRILSTVKSLGGELRGILLTHGHFDHIGAVPALQHAYPGIPLHIHEEDVIMLAHPQNCFVPDYPPIPLPSNIVASAWPDFVKVIETPGHTRGSVSLLLEDAGILFSGDTLFAGSAGRTDFPGGSYVELIASLKKLSTLPPETKIIPGHGHATTIAYELATNPFMLQL